MTAATSPRFLGTMDASPKQWPVKSDVTIKQGWLVGRYPKGHASAGMLDVIGADPSLICEGVSSFTLSTSTDMYVEPGIVPLFSTGLDETAEGMPAYGVDNQTFSLNDGGGAYPLIGIVWWVESSTVAHVKVGRAAVAEALSILAGPARVRAVITAIGTYAAASGTLTATANNATLTKDGVTCDVGDVLFLPPHLAAAAEDAGPYVLDVDTGASAEFVLRRPVWWQSGSKVPGGLVIDVGGEGSAYAGSQWKALPATNAKVIDTDDPGFWPRLQSWAHLHLSSGTYTLGAGGENIYLRNTGLAINVSQNTNGGTLGTNRIAAPVATRTAGIGGVGAVVVNSYVDAGTVETSDTSYVDLSWSNW